MPLPARGSSRRRRRKGPDEEERTAGSTSEVMAPTRMKLRVRRRDAAAAPPGVAPSEGGSERTRRSSRRKNGSKAATEAPPPSSASPPTTSSGTARPAVAAEASPDSKCPICLDRFNNLAYLDHCLHRFCFPCIQEWSHNKAECPLCKQPFASILHSVRAEDDFKEYTLQPPPRATNQLTASTFLTTVAAMTADGSTQHHLRLMLRRHLVAADREGVRRRRRRERAASGRGSADAMGEEWEFFMHSPPLPVSPYHLNVSEIIMDNMRVEEVAEEMMMMRREEERRQALNELAGLRGAAVAAPSTRASRRLMCRLAVRQRLQREGGLVRMREREATAFRKALYQCGIRVRGVSGNQGRHRAVTAESFRRSASHLNRLHAWLRRELAVLLGSHASLIDVVQRTIVARALDSGLEDATAVEEEVRPFLLARTEHFVHELLSFARSSLSMESYDQQAVYEPPAAAMDLDQLSSSSDGSSVIAISEGEEEEEGGGRSDAAAGGSHDDVIRGGSSLSLSGWDDETPGPSYTTAEPSHSLATSPALSPTPREPANQEGGEARGEEEECLIVGYKKPIAERTPELVQLSSDSEEEEGKKKDEEEEAASAKKTPPPPSYLPTIPPSTSGAFGAGQKEGGAQRQRSRSWSESSGRSGKSMCSLTPATPPTRRRRDGKQREDRSSSSRRKRKKKRGRDKSWEPPRRSGTFCNPNRSIIPPMMSRCSPSPFDSSADSASSPPQSPPDSSWELRFSQVSPITSSASSASLSPLLSSPPRTPPTPACSPKRPHHVEKPGGKRKYKSRHLNSNKDPSWRPNRARQRDRERKKKKKETPRTEAWRRDNGRKTGSSRRSRDDRSPSVEIIYEGTVDSSAAQPSGHKRRRRRQRRTQLTSSPVIITLDSNSSNDDDVHRKTLSGSSSPLSSQQTIDFSDLPSLPPLHSAGAAGNAEVGELPADILDRGSDCEAAGPSEAKRRADHSYVDVENVEDGVSLLETSDEPIAAAGTGGREPATGGERKPGRPAASPSDRYLLEAILNDLNRIAPPRRDLPQNTDRKRTPREIWLEERAGSGPTSTTSCQQNQVPSPPPLDKMEGREVPPLLRRASPVGSYNRNTPPPLKHKDAGSPQQWPQCSSGSDPMGRNSPVLLGLDKLAIPPITTLKNHLNSVFPSASHRLPAGSRPSGSGSHPSGSDYLPGLRFGCFPSTESHYSRGSLKRSLPDYSTPGNSYHSPDLHPAHRSSTSGGDRKNPTRLEGSDDPRSSSWDFFSWLNSNDGAAFPPEPPAGGTPSAAGFTPLPGAASNHKALPSSSSGSQNCSDPGSTPQPLQDFKVQFLHPNVSVPEPRNHLQPDSTPPNANLHDSTLQLYYNSAFRLSSDSSHRLSSDSSHRLSSDSSHRLSSDSSHRLSSDSSHRFSSDSSQRLSSDSSHRFSSDSSHRNFDPDNHPLEPRSEQRS